MGSVSHAQNMSAVNTTQSSAMPMAQQQQAALAASLQWQQTNQRRVPSLVNGKLFPRKPLHDLKIMTSEEQRPKQYTIDVSKGNMANRFTLQRSGTTPQLKMPTTTTAAGAAAASRRDNSYVGNFVSRVPQQLTIQHPAPANNSKMTMPPPPSTCGPSPAISKGAFNVEACTDEEVASQLLNLTRTAPNSNQTLETDTKSSCSSNYSSGNSKSGKRLKKVRQSDRYHRCCFCQRQYGCLSALSLHLRMKHPSLVKAMLGMDQAEKVEPIHARSIGAYANDVMTRKLFRPVHSLEEAVHICAVMNDNKEKSSAPSKKVSTTMGVPENVSTVKRASNVIGPSADQHRYNNGFMAAYPNYATAPMSFGADKSNYGFTGYRQEAVQA